jgi:hypothetical protein
MGKLRETISDITKRTIPGQYGVKYTPTNWKNFMEFQN